MCHQVVSLAARTFEEGGIPTVIMGSARDIVEECGVPRFLFTDFPLGNPCGKPMDLLMQSQILDMALELFESATLPRTTVQTPFNWDTNEWRDNYMAVREGDLEALALAGEERRKSQDEKRRSGMKR